MAAAICFGDVWARAVGAGPDRPFLTFERSDGEARSWSYGEFDALVDRVAWGLAERGVGSGSPVHIALTNSPAFVATWIATVRLGGWIVPADPHSRAPEIADQLDRTVPIVGICSPRRATEYRAGAAAAGRHPDIVETDEDDVELVMFPSRGSPAYPELGPRRRAAVMFTSGTTGRPKGVEVTQANYSFAGEVMADASNTTGDHRHLVVLPMFHANAQYYSVAAAIWAGASVALMPSFSASGFLTQAARHRVSHASLFAAPIRMILARGATPVEGVALAHCWYAMNIGDDQHATVTRLVGCRPRQLYGMTETIPAVLTEPAGSPDPASMGVVTSGCRVEVQRADGSQVADGEVGDVVVGGEPGITLFAGYLDDPGTTAASFHDGWFVTGDRARRDGDGRHRFDGRRADVLKVAGENVSTVEVEQVLSAHPKVLEAAVVGMPDAVRDEVPVGFAVAADADDAPTVEELHAWCAARLAAAKQPREITLVDELPRTSVGKIRKFVLKTGGT